MEAAPLLALALLALVPSGARGQEPEERPARAITGRVVTSDGHALPNAQVYAREVGAASGAPRMSQTDADGRFSVADLAPHAYYVWASAPSYVVATDPGTEQSSYYWPGSAVTVTLVKGGVITGTVMGADGEPVVAIQVRAERVREKGTPVAEAGGQPAMTDDRGIYRIYGLRAGEYRVVAGGASAFGGGRQGSPHDEEAPTYHPSATYDTARIVRVGLGDEIAGVDIQYRGLKGHAVSGTFEGVVPEKSSGVYIELHRLDGVVESSSFAFNFGDRRSFALYGVPDGQYEVVASCYGQSEATSMTKPVRVAVRGADVTGLRLVLEALGAIEGKVVLEPRDAEKLADGCSRPSGTSVVETALGWRRDEPPQPAFGWFGGDGADAAPAADGAFKTGGLRAAIYRVEPKLPGDGWYVKSILGPRPASGGAPPDLGRDGIAIASGRTVSGVTVTLAEGAAAVRGRVTAATEGKPVPSGARVFLVPADAANAENVPLYRSARAGDDGGFAISNVAPGKYWIVARAPVAEPDTRPLAWDRKERAKLHAEAEAAKQEVELGVCGQAADVVVRLK